MARSVREDIILLLSLVCIFKKKSISVSRIGWNWINLFWTSRKTFLRVLSPSESSLPSSELPARHVFTCVHVLCTLTLHTRTKIYMHECNGSPSLSFQITCWIKIWWSLSLNTEDLVRTCEICTFEPHRLVRTSTQLQIPNITEVHGMHISVLFWSVWMAHVLFQCYSGQYGWHMSYFSVILVSMDGTCLISVLFWSVWMAHVLFQCYSGQYGRHMSYFSVILVSMDGTCLISVLFWSVWMAHVLFQCYSGQYGWHMSYFSVILVSMDGTCLISVLFWSVWMAHVLFQCYSGQYGRHMSYFSVILVSMDGTCLISVLFWSVWTAHVLFQCYSGQYGRHMSYFSVILVSMDGTCLISVLFWSVWTAHVLCISCSGTHAT